MSAYLAYYIFFLTGFCCGSFFEGQICSGTGTKLAKFPTNFGRGLFANMPVVFAKGMGKTRGVFWDCVILLVECIKLWLNEN